MSIQLRKGVFEEKNKLLIILRLLLTTSIKQLSY